MGNWSYRNGTRSYILTCEGGLISSGADNILVLDIAISVIIPDQRRSVQIEGLDVTQGDCK